MIRVKDLDESIRFFNILGLKETRRIENEKGKFTLVFMAAENEECQIELTYNWNGDEEYTNGRNFGHLAFKVDNIYEFCEKLIKNSIELNRPPRDGKMAFIKTPDSISIEIIQEGEPLEIKEPWCLMKNIGNW